MPLLIVLFILVPIAEIYVIIKVGEAIGALWTVLLLVADSIIGARLVAWQGRAAWRRFQEALSGGRVPHREILDGVMIILGGAFLLTPGFLTDVIGLLLLLPPTRAIIRRAAARSIRRRGVVARVAFSAPSFGSRPSSNGADVEGRQEPRPGPRELPPG
jgi:UPF0716 protein FxsA